MAWQDYDAKARFSEFLDASLKSDPQIITKRGMEAAVRISIGEWKHLRRRARQSIPDPLLDPNGPLDIPFGPRSPFKLRPFDYAREEGN